MPCQLCFFREMVSIYALFYSRFTHNFQFSSCYKLCKTITFLKRKKGKPTSIFSVQFEYCYILNAGEIKNYPTNSRAPSNLEVISSFFLTSYIYIFSWSKASMSFCRTYMKLKKIILQQLLLSKCSYQEICGLIPVHVR